MRSVTQEARFFDPEDVPKEIVLTFEVEDGARDAA